MLCQPAIRSLTVLAPAKLNLFLRIVRRRDDGFHELETVMTAINLFDTLRFDSCDSSEIQLRVIMAGTRNSLTSPSQPIPTGLDNLVGRAAQLIRQYAGVSHGVQITLTKRIPAAAGMGGGSSDAAATLSGLNRLWNLSLSRAELLDLAAQLGSDIGFFLGGGSTAVCRGRGEIVEPLSHSAGLHFVVARPATGLSTPQVFKHCRPDDQGPDLESFVESMKQSNSSRLVRLLHNGLQGPAESLNHEVQELRERFCSLPVLGHQMSGSGTSYFGICASARHAQTVAARLRASGVPWVHIARSCP
ncbi:4-(cytidine 5'-diphospho)-2-C-methyl-D-erythritol kinase [Schlesneria paludicola]|uniref:4-(cytidine 5'-diphospho)-2-C-methyl-D-erythritol kinase n=1 Tax=Schlesneria paludicola TaxID=360056 RepID=UPI00029A0FF5|nr:4-(cytidine 5'-diphospho)-2-C-methyl-D-erythritol kinase [Schlesneria paludicola]